jgi:hypothetical protein
MTLYIYSNRHITDNEVVKSIKPNSWIILENELSRKRWSLLFKYNKIKEDKLNIVYISLNDILKGALDNMKSRFDCGVMNPPFKHHVELFNIVVDLIKDGGTISCIQPSTPFINRKLTGDTVQTKIIKENVSEYKTRLTLFDGNKMFNAGYFVPLSTTELTKVKDKNIEVIYSHIDSTNEEVIIYDKLDDIFVHGNDIVLSIRDKVFSKMNESIYDKLARNGSYDNFYLRINTIGGHPPKKGTSQVNSDFYCMIYKEKENNISDLITNVLASYNTSVSNRVPSRLSGDKNYVSFSTEVEALNCGNYLLTYFARFCVSLFKINVQFSRGELRAVPYLDFTKEWTDELLYEEFGISDDEKKYIESYIGKWYERDFIK